jgi:hypothetical protein
MPAYPAMNVVIRAIALLVLLVLSNLVWTDTAGIAFAAPDPNPDRYRRER